MMKLKDKFVARLIEIQNDPILQEKREVYF